jgi:hypothetical protein
MVPPLPATLRAVQRFWAAHSNTELVAVLGERLEYTITNSDRALRRDALETPVFRSMVSLLRYPDSWHASPEWSFDEHAMFGSEPQRLNQG